MFRVPHDRPTPMSKGGRLPSDPSKAPKSLPVTFCSLSGGVIAGCNADFLFLSHHQYTAPDSAAARVGPIVLDGKPKTLRFNQQQDLVPVASN